MQEKDDPTGGGNKGRNLKATFLFFSKACKKLEQCTYDSLYSSEIVWKLSSLKKPKCLKYKTHIEKTSF